MQRCNAEVKHAIAALPVNICSRITGHGRHDLHPVLLQEFGQILLTRLKQDGQVAAVDHAHALLPRSFDQRAKAAVQLRRATGQVQGAQTACSQHAGNQRQGVLIHHFDAIRAGVDMAVQATLVAQVAQVDLQRGQGLAANCGEIRVFQQWQGVVHKG